MVKGGKRVSVAFRYHLVLALLLLHISGSAALDPTVLNCASVDASGDVTITWTAPPDPGGELGNYQVYSSSSYTGPYVPLFTVPAGTTSWIHPGANADLGPVFYYVTTVTNGPAPEESLPSDTVATFFLEVFQSTPPGSANITWDALAVAPTADDTFSVWMEYPIGSWQLIGEVDATTFSYQHVISVCDDSLTFRVERTDTRGCISVSNLDGDAFQDVTPPSSPVISVVTVDTLTGLATVDWEPSPEADTDGYIIVFEALSGGVIIDTIFGQNNTSYEWPESLADIRAESYTVAAFDTCETGTPPSPNTSATLPMHTSMLLEAEHDVCGGEITLFWTAYVGWTVADQQVFVQVDGGPWTLLGALDGTSLSFTHAVEPFHTYCYAIRASRGNGLASSLSNSACVTTDYPGLPAFNYLRTVTVSGAEEITIVDSVDVFAIVQGYRLERSENGGPFEIIGTRAPGPDAVLVFLDTDVAPASNSYQYRVVVLDGCGREAFASNIGANIVLSATSQLTGVDQLEWNGYQDWAGTIQAHALYRQIANDPFQLLNILPPDPWEYMDDVSIYTNTTGRFCYYVIALESGNPSGINAVSQSNVACAVQEELVYIPNAFVMGGQNPVFQPVLSYADVSEYELSIINRWGQVFWTSYDPLQSWDGTSGGKPVPMGVYGYYCNFKNGAGRVFEKRGTVTVLSALE